MTSARDDLQARYRAALADYVQSRREEDLARAYEIGRDAMAQGLGVLSTFCSRT